MKSQRYRISNEKFWIRYAKKLSFAYYKKSLNIELVYYLLGILKVRPGELFINAGLVL
jgi:hypothetical protein